MIKLFCRNSLYLLSLIVAIVVLTHGCAGTYSGDSKAMRTSTAEEQIQINPEQRTPVVGNSATPLSETTSPASKLDTNEDNRSANSRIYKGTGVMVNSAQSNKPIGIGAISLNFEAADIRDIAKTVLAEILKESYIVDPKVGGTISFRTTNPLPQEALLPTLETILRMNGVVMIKENGIFKIMTASSARGSVSPRTGDRTAGYSIHVVPLKYVGTTEMVKLLEPFSPDPTAIKADELRNLLILSGTQNEIQHMLDTISLFDVDWLSGMSIGLFSLQNTDVKSLSTEINKIFGDKASNPLAGVVRIVPIERLNGFVIITPQPHYLDQAKLWIERLDKSSGQGGAQLHVYHVQNGKAEHLADLLNQAFSNNTSSTPSKPSTATVAPGLTPAQISSTPSIFGSGTNSAQVRQPAATPPVSSTLSITDENGSRTSEIRIVADKDSNTLLILANSAGYDKIEAALRKLDTPPRQVLIEVMIAEVSLTDQLSWGIEWLFTNGPRKSGKLDMGTAGLTQTTPGFSYALTDAVGTNIKAVLNMLATENKVNVLSSPHIMVTDNQTAKIQVGDSVPIQGQVTATTTGTVTSVQYLDTGVILSVTPRINSSGLVNLDILQEFSIPGSINAALANSPTVSKRSAKTQVSVQSGETMVLGGLISERSSNGSGGLPLLSSIPVLGGLFGTTDRSTSKTELIVLITPRVAHNSGQGKLLSDELQKKMGETKGLLDCGTANLAGYTTRGGLWCMQPRRFEGAIDKGNGSGTQEALEKYPAP